MSMIECIKPYLYKRRKKVFLSETKIYRLDTVMDSSIAGRLLQKFCSLLLLLSTSMFKVRQQAVTRALFTK